MPATRFFTRLSWPTLVVARDAVLLAGALPYAYLSWHVTPCCWQARYRTHPCHGTWRHVAGRPAAEGGGCEGRTGRSSASEGCPEERPPHRRKMCRSVLLSCTNENHKFVRFTDYRATPAKKLKPTSHTDKLHIYFKHTKRYTAS